MATRSIIGILREDGLIESIYCHNDGYFDWNGKMLFEHYNSEEMARALVALGSLSSIQQNIAPVGPHSFDQNEGGVTVAYHRDRGDPWSRCRPTVEAWNDLDLEQYTYLWDVARGCWIAASHGTTDRPVWHTLKALSENMWDNDGRAASVEGPQYTFPA